MTILGMIVGTIFMIGILYPWRNKATEQFRKSLKPGDKAIYKWHRQGVRIQVSTRIDDTIICYPLNNPDQRNYVNINDVYPI